MYQKCPICDGEGTIIPGPVSTEISKQCPTCLGRRIIHQDTGLPAMGVAVPTITETHGGSITIPFDPNLPYTLT